MNLRTSPSQPKSDSVVWGMSCRNHWTLLLWKWVWTSCDSYSRTPQRHAGNISHTTLTNVTRAWTIVVSERWCYCSHSENFHGCALWVVSIMTDFSLWWCALASSLTRPLYSWLFLWGYLKSKVFGSWPANLNEQKTRIWDEISNLTEDMLQEVMRRFSILVHQCIQHNGAHITDLLFKKWNTESKCHWLRSNKCFSKKVISLKVTSLFLPLLYYWRIFFISYKFIHTNRV
jgi:hypothetical protein